MSRSGFLALFSFPTPASFFGNLGAVVQVWDSRLRMRASLARLDAHMLRDIGVDAASAEEEAAKPFWRD